MATKTADPKSIVEDTTKAVEDAVAKAQDQYLTALSEGQALVIESYKAVGDAVAKLNLPAMPTIPGVGEFYNVPTEAIGGAVDGAFDFTAKVLENQRAFAKKIIEVAKV